MDGCLLGGWIIFVPTNSARGNQQSCVSLHLGIYATPNRDSHMCMLNQTHQSYIKLNSQVDNYTKKVGRMFLQPAERVTAPYFCRNRKFRN